MGKHPVHRARTLADRTRKKPRPSPGFVSRQAVEELPGILAEVGAQQVVVGVGEGEEDHGVDDFAEGFSLQRGGKLR